MNNEYQTPNKYRENPDFDEAGVRADVDAFGAYVAGIAIVGGIVALIAGFIAGFIF